MSLLASGTRVGVYEVVAPIGAGGMGEVYRALDTRLKRDVALKILPESFASDPDRLVRFQREAEVLASLNHPNIAQIYGIDESNGTRALVMELVEGEDLSQRIGRGAIPIDEALPIAMQIAEALEAAHEQGIIHRDLKPANIKVRPDGTVKVLDFGLAKLAESNAASNTSPPALSMSPTITSPALVSGVGVLLGTAAYMSPEQAKGKVADKRSDLWAFGCVFFEMLTGKRPFDGEDVTDVLGAVVRLEPNWNLLPSEVPAPIQTLLRRCLEKDRRRRIADVSTALFVIDERTALGGSALPASSVRALWPGLASHGTGVVLAALSAAAGVWFLMQSAPSPVFRPVFRSHLVTTGPTALTIQGNDIDFAITPDGSRVIYRGANQLVVRRFDTLAPQVLTGLGAPREPFFSPDGQWIGYFDGASVLKKVAITGGPPVTITKVDGTGPRGATWGTDGSIVFATQADSGLLRVSATGGEPTVLTTPRREVGETDHRWPEFLPGGRALLFTIFFAGVGGLDSAQLAVLDLSTGKYNVILRGGYHAHYLATGHLVYGASGTMRAVGFDLGRLQVVGVPVPVLDSVLTAGSGAVQAAVAANGTLVYLPSVPALNAARSLVWVTRDGREEPVAGARRRAYDSFQLSPDGGRAVLQISDQENDIWIWDFGRQTLTRMTFGPQLDYDPLWTPDGRHILFTRGSVAAAGVIMRAADGTGPEAQVAEGNVTTTSISPDGKQLIVWQLNDIGVVTMKTDAKVRPLIHTMFDEGRAYISPDGRWLAYQSNESGEDQIFVQPFPQLSGGRWQVSPAGGIEPAWARNGRELFYIDGTGSLVAVPVQTEPTFTTGNPKKLFEAHYVGVSGTRRYDVTADGQRFLFIKGPSDASDGSPSSNLVLVQQWAEDLKRLVPTK